MMAMDKQLSHTIGVMDVYPKGYTIPEGYRLVGFRAIKRDESYLSNETGRINTCDHDVNNLHPRIIVEVIKRKQVIFTETGEERRVQFGEWYIFGDTFLKWTANVPSQSYYPIYTRTEKEV